MGVLIQYKCIKCGFETPGYLDCLIDPLGQESCYICSCRDCSTLFQRNLKDDHPIDKCTHCGSNNINIYANEYAVPCPKCGEKKMSCDCVGTFF